MNTADLLSLITFFAFIICGIVYLVMVIIIGRTRMKEVDKYYYGFNVDNDSIFYQLVRFPIYANIFASRWYARLVGHLDMYEHFDKKFKRPFLLASMFVLLGLFLLLSGLFIDKYYL